MSSFPKYSAMGEVALGVTTSASSDPDPKSISLMCSLFGSDSLMVMMLSGERGCKRGLVLIFREVVIGC